MRIIAGSLGGRRLPSPRGRLVRPVGERLRESVFSALGRACEGAEVADLFAGSGAFGFEALSRGANRVTFVEKRREIGRRLEDSARELGVRECCSIVCADVFAYLFRLERPAFDLVFADPPFAAGLADRVFTWWRDYSPEQSILILKYPAGESSPAVETGAGLLKSARFGESAYAIYLNQPDQRQNG
ncbi:MAG: RsmD family RNA methyltransferase [Candidatus Glassbacteria bacterium]